MQQAFRREIDELKEHRQQLEVEDMCKAEELKAIEKKLTERDELLQALALNINACQTLANCLGLGQAAIHVHRSSYTH